MARTNEILEMLIPTGGYVVRGDTFEGVEFIEATPITKAQFDQGVLDYPAWAAAREQAQATKIAAVNAKLFATTGLTPDDLATLGMAFKALP